MADYICGTIKGPVIFRRRSVEEMHNATLTLISDGGDELEFKISLSNTKRGSKGPVTDKCKSVGQTNAEWHGGMLKALLPEGATVNGKAFVGIRVQILVDATGDFVGIYPDAEILDEDAEIGL